MISKKIGLAVTGVLLSGGLVAGAAGAYAETGAPPTTTPTATSTAPGASDPGPRDGQHGRPNPRLTKVTGAEQARVVTAVKAKDSAVTVKGVRKASDGSYLVRGVKADKRVFVTVSQDLKSVEVRERPGQITKGERRGECGPRDQAPAPKS